MLEDIPYADKARNIDDALRYMHENYGGHGKEHSIGSIARFIGVRKGKVQVIEENALRKVKKLLRERDLSEYDHD